MNRVLLILLLVSFSGSYGISVSDDSYGLRTLANFSSKNDNGTRINATEDRTIVKELSVESTAVSQQEDQDPIESSETIVYNRFEKPSERNEESSEEEEEPEGPPDHAIPYSEHEEPRNVPTRPKYIAPGEWARSPKNKDVPLDFVPTKVYAQVRKSHVLKRLPRKKAIENAESDEEKENAARLREVVKNSKVNTVYTEEGYEDSAYDHAGHIRDADFHEGYAKKLHDHLDVKKKSGDDDYDGANEEESETRQKPYEKVHPEEFKDFDEDYSDRYESNKQYGTDRNFVHGDDKLQKEMNPKLTAERGIEKLQEDLEREAEEIEKGVEIGKLEKVQTTTDRETLAESQRYHRQRNDQSRKKGRTRKRPSSLTKNDYPENLEVFQATQNVENSTRIPLDEGTPHRGIETTTSNEGVENFSSYKHEVAEISSPNVDPNDFQRAEESPTTVSYGQLFWDYFKARQNQLTTTEVPLNLESTTSTPNLLQASNSARNVNNFVSYSVHEGSTTAFPITGPEISSPQQIVPGQVLNYGQNDQLTHLGGDNVNEYWQQTNINAPLTTEATQYSEIYDEQIIPLSNTPKNLDNHESNKNLDNSLFNPTLNSFVNRRPRYKITIRHKPRKESIESLISRNRESFTSIPVGEPLIASTSEAAPINENYMKVLMHLNNEKKIKSLHHPNGLQQQNSFYPQSSKNNLEIMTRMRPPLPQKTTDYYYNFAPRNQVELDVAQSDWSSFPVSQRPHQTYTNPRSSQTYPEPLSTVQMLPFPRERNTILAFDLVPPATPMRNDQIRNKESMDYVNQAGNRLRQGRNVLRPFRQTIGPGIRVKRRERRSVVGDDESYAGVVKGARSMVNNSRTNRGEIERAAKNLSIERNCSQKVTRRVEVGLVPDTKQPGEKKSRSCANNRGEGSRAVERESNMDCMNVNEGSNRDLTTLTYNEGDQDKNNGANLAKRRRIAEEMEEKHEELSDRPSKVKSLGEESKIKYKHDGESGVNLLRNKRNAEEREEKHEELSDEAAKVRSLEEESKMKNKHEELLDEAPKVSEDVIDKEINARFNENEEKDEEEEENRDKNIEVEVPEFDYVEELNEEDQANENVSTEVSLDLEKYPFYNNEQLPSPSALKYAMDPGRLPKKTYGGMEFYNLRDKYKQCDEVEPSLDVSPEKEEPVPDRGPNEKGPRLRGLGDKLDCFKAKYFDENPFDNPLFQEEEVTDPIAPPQMESKQFASRIMMFPKENDDYVIQKPSRRPENYRQPRKPSSTVVRLQNRRPVRYKSYPRTRRRKRPQVYRVNASQVKYLKPKRPQKNEKRPITSASEISSVVTPYQNQVYEDVMGTIKSMANSYQVYEVTTLPASEENTEDTNDDVVTNSPVNSTNYGIKEKDGVQIDIEERPRKVNINIKGMAPSRNRNRHRSVQRRPRVPQRPKTRIQMIRNPVGGLRIVKHGQKLRVYRRGLRDKRDLSASYNEKSSEVSGELDSIERKMDEVEAFFNSEENSNRRTNSENTTSKVNSSMEDNENRPLRTNSTNSGIVSRSMDVRRKPMFSKIITDDTSRNNEDQKKDRSQKVIYTIKDRIRYSKPKGELRKFGKFVNETRVEENSRRKEPQYNYIRRKSSSKLVSTTTEPSLISSTDSINWTEAAVIKETIIEPNSQERIKENEETAHLVDETKNENLNASESVDRLKQDLSERPSGETANKTGSGYAVYENVNEGEVTTTQKPQSATPSEFFNLKTFLKTDLPSYSDFSPEEYKKSLFTSNNSSNNIKINPDSANTSRIDNERDTEENTSKTFHPSYFSNEESSEKVETNAKVRSSTESSEEGNVPSRESASEEDRTFFTYTSRPSSPAENYEDEKFSDLGQRVNKPEFFHPPFSFSSKPRARGSSEETEDTNEEKEEYVFPWYRDKEDQRKRKRNRNRGKSTGEYEYPWERRERLAREEKRRKEEKRKRLVKGFDEDDEEAEETFLVKNRRNAFPRGRYRYWSRRDRDTSEDDSSDNVESSSEYRPLMRYSSRYNSKSNKLPVDEKTTNARSRSVEEISRSIKKALEDKSKEKETSEEKENDSSEEKKAGVSYGTRGISKGMIVPEDVTLAPTRRTGRREKSKMDVTSENRNSSELARNNLDNSESQITVVKANPKEIANSTNDLNSSRQLNKKRRRILKSNTSTVENTTKSVNDVNRSRRRQRTSSTTPATITSTSSAGTTLASRVARRRNQKTAKDLKKNDTFKVLNKSVSDETSTSRSGTVEQRSEGKNKNRTNEIANEEVKNAGDRERSRSSRKKVHSEKFNDSQEKNPQNETNEKGSMKFDGEKKEETSDSKQTFSSVKSDERFDFKDDRIDTLSDFISPEENSGNDRDYAFDGVKEAETEFTPQNRAVQLSELSSREIVSSVSWISENYDF